MGGMRDKILLKLVKSEIWQTIYRLKYIHYDMKKPVIKHHKISICTNCMGRSSDVKQTYEKNILDNIDYPNIEFILLNYNSKDDLDEYVKNNLMKYIDKGILNYYKTIEPKYYSMTHSRNISFKVATGDIVNNVDADHFINKGFAEYVNLLANQGIGERQVFIKSSQKNRGRIGMFKEDFMKLGGYNEEIKGYGHDDKDLLLRAHHSGMKISKYGGSFCTITPDHKRHPTDNYEDKRWKHTQRKNILISMFNLMYPLFEANIGFEWGKAELLKNFNERVSI